MKRCLACNEPSESRFCPACTDLEYADVIRDYCTHATSTSPLDMAQEIMSHPKFPVAGQAHHPLVVRVECPFPEKNKVCNREACRYFPVGAAAAAAPQPRLIVIEEVA